MAEKEARLHKKAWHSIQEEADAPQAQSLERLGLRTIINKVKVIEMKRRNTSKNKQTAYYVVEHPSLKLKRVDEPEFRKALIRAGWLML